jgi:nucleotide-binding universal stress UspA family protein
MGEKIERILVAVDGSEQSNKAVRLAATIAKCMGAELTLMHVVEMNEVPSLMAEAEDKGGEAQGRAALSDSVEIALGEGVQAKTVLRRGHAAGQILRFALEYQPQMIFTGSRGRGGATAMLMGSVSRKVTEGSKIPVTIVR